MHFRLGFLFAMPRQSCAIQLRIETSLQTIRRERTLARPIKMNASLAYDPQMPTKRLSLDVAQASSGIPCFGHGTALCLRSDLCC